MINRARAAIQRAGELGVGVVAMTPVAGGVLSCPSPALREAIGLDLPTPAIALHSSSRTRTSAPPAPA